MSSRLRAAFDEIDVDQSGAIDVWELKAAFTKLGYGPCSSGVSEAESDERLETLIRLVDVDKNGRVQFDEFERVFGHLAAMTKDNRLLLQDIMRQWSDIGAIDVGSDLCVSGAGHASGCNKSIGGEAGHTRSGGNLSSGEVVAAHTHFPLWYFVFAGGMAGVCSRTLTAPLERAKIQMQVGQQSASVLQLLQTSYTSGGLRVVFAGNVANCVRVFPLMGLSCLFYGQINSFFVQYESPKHGESSYMGNHQVSGLQRFVSGALAGGLANTLTYPLDVVRARVSVLGADARILSVISGVLRDRAAFRGLGTTLLTAAPMIGLTQASYDVLKAYIIVEHQWMRPSAASFGFLGGLAGIAAQVTMFPMDSIRRRFQVAESKSVQTILRKTVTFEEIRGLYRGVGTACFKVLPGVAVSLTVRDWLLGRF